jgi:hypothetical protein
MGPVGGGGGLIGIQNSDQNAYIILQKQAQYGAYVRYRIAPLRLYDDSSSPGTLPLGLVVRRVFQETRKEKFGLCGEIYIPECLLI